MESVLILIQGQNLNEESLSLNTRGYTSEIIGMMPPHGDKILIVTGISASNLEKARSELAHVPGVTSVITLVHSKLE